MPKKKIYQVDNKSLEKLKKDLYNNKLYYINKLYNKLQVNFVAIKLVYDLYTAAFPS